MKVAPIVNTMETYNNLKNKIENDKKEVKEYELFDRHYGLNDAKIKELYQRIRVNQKNMRILLNSDIKDVPKLDLMV